MARSIQKKVKFSKGQIDERLLERSDTDIINSSASTITNIVSTPYGSIEDRQGLENIDLDILNKLEYTVTSSYLDDTEAIELGGFDETTALGSVPSNTTIAKFDFGSIKTVDNFSFKAFFNGTNHSGGLSAFTMTPTIVSGVITDVVLGGVPTGQNMEIFSVAAIDPLLAGSGAIFTSVHNDAGQLIDITVTNGGSGYSGSTYLFPSGITLTTNTLTVQTSTDDITYTTIDTFDMTVANSFVTSQLSISPTSDIRYVRLVTDPCNGLITIGNVTALGGEVTNIRQEPFMFNQDQKYLISMSSQTINIYDDSIGVDWSIDADGLLNEYLDDLKYTQQEDVAVITHKSMPVKKLVRDTAYSTTFSANASTDIITGSGVEFYNNFKIQLTTTGTLPAGLSLNTDYYVIEANGTSCKLSATLGGTAIDITGTGTGTHTLTTQEGYWTFSDATLTNIPKYAFDGETTTAIAQTLTPSAVEGTVTLTLGAGDWSALGGTIGQYVDGGGGRVKITELDPADVKIAYGYTIIPFYTTNAIASGDWDIISGYEDVWSSTRGYPSTCVFYQQRLWFGGSKERPNTIWASRVSDYFNFNNSGSNANDSIEITLASTQVNEILNLYPNRGLQVLTAGDEWLIPEGNLTPDGISITRTTSNGSLKKTYPIDISGTTLFIEKNGRSLLSFVYNEVQNSYVTSNLSLLTDLINNPIDMAIAYNSTQNEANYLYIVNADGTMTVACILLDRKINSYVKYTTNGLFKSVTVVGDDVYVTVSRDFGLGVEKFTSYTQGNTDNTRSIAPSYPPTGFSGWLFTPSNRMYSTPFTTSTTASALWAEIASAGFTITSISNLTSTYPSTDFNINGGEYVVILGTAYETEPFIPADINENMRDYSFISGSNGFSRTVGDEITVGELGDIFNGSGIVLDEINYFESGYSSYNYSTQTSIGIGVDTIIEPDKGYLLTFTSNATWNEASEYNKKDIRVPKEMIGEDIYIHDADNNYGKQTNVQSNVSLDPAPAGNVYVGLPFTYTLNSNKIAINGQTGSIHKRISEAVVETLNTDTLTLNDDTQTSDEDLFRFRSVTNPSRDPRFTIEGEFDHIEVLSILLNLNHGRR